MIDPPQDGAWNMAVDEALLDDAADQGIASLRFYQWREPTLSLGYFQPHRERECHPPSRDAALVRRLSGGGALLHDRELTYSLALPATHALARESATLYEAVHRSLINSLAELGVAATLYADLSTERETPAPTDEPFLCFSRRFDADVVMPTSAGIFKIVGSAQRRRRGAVLQHGAVLLAASPKAPELPGIDEMAGVTLSPEGLADRFAAAISRELFLTLGAESPSAELAGKSQDLQRSRYGCRSWSERR